MSFLFSSVQEVDVEITSKPQQVCACLLFPASLGVLEVNYSHSLTVSAGNGLTSYCVTCA